MSNKATILTELRTLASLNAKTDDPNDPVSNSALLHLFIIAIDKHLIDIPTLEPSEPEEITNGITTFLSLGGTNFRCDCSCNLFQKSTTVPLHYKCNACGAWHTGEPEPDEDMDPEIEDANNNHGQGD